MYYLNLAPGETKHYTFFFDKHLFNPEMSYYFRIYTNKMHDVMISLPEFVKYFATDPTSSIDVVEQRNDGTGDGPVIDLRGISYKNKLLRPGLYIRNGKKVIVR